MGLLDYESFDPKTLGLLGAGARMLQLSVGQPNYVGIGGVLGGGVQAGINDYQEAIKAQREKEKAAMLMAAEQSLIDQRKAKAAQELGISNTIKGVKLDSYGQETPMQVPGINQQQAPVVPNILDDYFKNKPQDQPYQPTQSIMQDAIKQNNLPPLPILPTSQNIAPPTLPSQQSQAMVRYNNLMKQADALNAAGYDEAANKLYKTANPMREVYGTSPHPVTDENGKLVNMLYNTYGGSKIADGGVRPDNKLMNNGQSEQVINMNDVTPGQQFQKFATPGELLTNARGNQQLAQSARFHNESLGQAERHYQENKALAGEPMTPAALENAAIEYNMTRKFPNLGMGKSAGMAKIAIANRGAEILAENGIAPEDAMKGSMTNKAATTALNKLQTQETAVGAFSRTMDKNIDNSLGIIGQVDNTGAPLINKWINAGRLAAKGDKSLTNLNLYVEAIANEYAKIMSGNMGNAALAQTATERVHKLFNSAMNEGQFRDAAQTIRNEADNRINGFIDEKKSLMKSIFTSKGNAQGATQPNNPVNDNSNVKVPSIPTKKPMEGKNIGMNEIITAQKQFKAKGQNYTTEQITKMMRDAGATIGGQ